MFDFVENKLKTITIKDLETIIAKSITDALGEEFEAVISSIDFGGVASQEATLQVKLAHPYK